MSFSAKKLAPGFAGVLCLLLFAGSASGFNARAHQVVGHVAAAHVCAETLTAVYELDGERDLAAAGLWADEIRSNKRMDFAKRWHYINVPDQISVAKYLADQRRRGGDVLFAIEHFSQRLGDATLDQSDRVQAYRFLVHFVADVHQPLHVGRKKDQGGNRVKVQVGERRTRLHSFWDGFELNRVIDDPRDYAAYLQQRYGGAAVKIQGNPVDWAQESKNFRDQIYAFGPVQAAGAHVLSDDYRDKAINIINLRMYQAGRRLAATLDRVFCTSGANR